MSFEFDGEKYKVASRHQKAMGRDVIAEFELRGNEAILDLGCGDGVLTERLAELVPAGRVIGIDASSGMIKTAVKLRRHNLAFLQADINELNYKNEFDVIFSNAALHWIMDHTQLLQNVRRALKPGGIARFNFAAAGNCANFFEVVRHVMADESFSGYFSQFEWPWYMPTIADYDALVSRSSFSEARVWGEIRDVFFENAEEMIGWLDQPALVPFLKVFDGADAERFRSAVIEQMLDRTMYPSGKCFETGRRVNIFARK